MHLKFNARGPALLIMMIALSSVFIGCWEARQKSDNGVIAQQMSVELMESQAQFVRQAVSANAFESPERHPGWGSPEGKVYEFQTCLETKSTGARIKGQSFRIIGDGPRVYRSISDVNGCIRWKETVRFNFYADSKYIMLHRTVVGESLSEGRLPIKLAINPWASYRKDPNPELVDLHFGSIPIGYQLAGDPDRALRGGIDESYPISMQNISIKVTQIEESQSETLEDRLQFLQRLIKDRKTKLNMHGKEIKQDLASEVADDPLIAQIIADEVISPEEIKLIRKHQVQDGEGVQIELLLEGDPSVMVKSANGAQWPGDIYDQAKFKVWAHVAAIEIGAQHDQNMILTPLSLPQPVQVDRTGKIRHRFKSPVYGRAFEGRLALVLRVEPVGAPPGVSKFEAKYILGNYDELAGSPRPFEYENNYGLNQNFDFAEFLSSPKTLNSKELMQTGTVLNMPKYEFGPLDIRFETIMPGETSTQRTVIFRVETCPVHTLTGKPAKNRTFQVRQLGRNDRNQFPVMQVYSDSPFPAQQFVENGCISWLDQVTHRYYQSERLYFPEVEVTDGEGFSKTLTMVLNPWDEKWTFARDRRVLTEDYINSIERRQKIGSKLFMQGFNYQTLRFTYEIDEFMNLKVKKTILLKVQPEVLRYSSIVQGRRATEPLRDGIYIMRVAYQKYYLDPTSKGGHVFAEQSEDYDTSDRDGARIDLRTANQDGVAIITKVVPPLRHRVRFEGGQQVRKREHISIVEKLVRVQNGQVITPITIEMRDLRLMRIRAQLFIEFQTIDENMLQIVNVINDDMLANFEEAHRQKFLEYRKQINKEYHDILAQLPPGALKTKNNILERHVKELAFVRITKDEERDLFDARRESKIEQIIHNLRGYQLSLFNGEQVRDVLKRTGGDIDISDQLVKELDNSLALNDFTKTKVSPLADLNTLVDFDSGLPRRTFVGPLTLLGNQNGSYVQPTDNLDGAFCREASCDSETLEEQMQSLGRGSPYRPLPSNIEYERNAYYNYLGEFYCLSISGDIGGACRDARELAGLDPDVEPLIKREQRIEEEYFYEQKMGSLISTVTQDLNLYYVSLTNQQPEEVDQECIRERSRAVYGGAAGAENISTRIRDCFYSKSISNQIDFRYLLESLNRPRGPAKYTADMTSNDLLNLIEGRSVGEHVQKRMCLFFSRHMSGYEYDKLSRIEGVPSGFEKIYSECIKVAQEMGLNYVIGIDRKLRIKQPGPYRFKGGKSMNINVGANFTLNYSESLSLGFNIFEWGGLGLGGFKALKTDIKRMYNNVDTNGTMVSEGTYLVMQQATFDIGIDTYEQCAVIRWNPAFMSSSGFFSETLKKYDFDPRDPSTPWSGKVLAEHQARKDRILKGIFLCKGQDDIDPIIIRERYYYFTQHFTEGDMLDPGDIYNHPWLLMLRGIRDARTFLFMMREQKFVDREMKYVMDLYDESLTKMNSGWDRLRSIVAEPVAKDDIWPIKHLAQTYLQVSPTYPQLYSVIPSENDIVKAENYPMVHTPENSFSADFGDGLEIPGEEEKYYARQMDNLYRKIKKATLVEELLEKSKDVSR